ncbi:MAG: helix-turn-helix transcriptional regulator [Bacteroidetes bacterium]|nr:helix-turn-helix transcriptional regulator [Bacteroidota bacterium]
MKFIGNTNEFLQLKILESQDCSVFNDIVEGSLIVLWFEGDHNALTIDGKDYVFTKNQIVFLTEFHKVKVNCLETTRFLRFNRSFYCVIDHDKEVGCKGILFFGASQLPVIQIPDEDLEQFEILWKMFSIEMQSKDNLQIDMLQMMLKRYLILCTRLFKTQQRYPDKTQQSDIIRDFNFLVEQHFKTKHSVAEYAELLYKSPKTLSNIFSKLGSKTPLQYIQERKMLEARRRLRYSDLQIQEIAFEIGFEDIQAFSRFFKKKEGVSPSVFKKKI